ncbi:MAG: ABC transporter substrate-binding protein [Polaromonas sp.]
MQAVEFGGQMCGRYFEETAFCGEAGGTRGGSGWLRGMLAALMLGFAGMAPALAASDIKLVQIGPFTVLPTPDATQVNQGIKAFVNQANKTGINGHRIAFTEADDRFNVDVFVEQFGKVVQEKPLALLSPIGSSAVKRMLDDKLLDSADIVVMNAIPGAESFRSPGHPKLFHIRAGDKQQIEKIITHVRTLGIKRLSVLHEDLPVGTSGMAVAQQVATPGAGVDIKGVKSAITPEELAKASREVATQSPQGVLIVGTPRFMADGVAALRKSGVSQAIFVLSYAPAPLIVKLAGLEGARGVGIAQTFPNPNGRTLPIHRDFQAAMKAMYPQLQEYTPFHLEGYITARTLAEAIRRMKDREPSPANLVNTLHSMGELDFGGFRVDFSKGNVGSTFVDIGVIGSDGRLRY